MGKVGQNYGLKMEKFLAGEVDIGEKLGELISSGKEYYIAAQVEYNETGCKHWVGVNDYLSFNGEDCIEISPTSVNDTVKANRRRDSWQLGEDGKMYVEVSDITKIYVFEKDPNFKKGD